MILINPNVAKLGALAADECSRYSMTGIHVTELAYGAYRAAATDGRYLGIVEGKRPEKAADYPELNAINAAPNGATEAIIPPAALTEIAKSLPKRAKAPNKPILAYVAAVFGEKGATLAVTDRTEEVARQPLNVEGRFPDVLQVVPRNEPTLTVTLDPERLAELCKVAATYADAGDGQKRIVMELRKDKAGYLAPIIIRCENDEQKFTGLLMPMSDAK